MNVVLTIIGILLLIGAGVLWLVSLTTRQRRFFYGSVGAGILGIVLVLVGLTVVFVGPNERMVVFDRVNGDMRDPEGPGIAFINPLTTSYRIYSVARQTYTMSSTLGEGQVYGDDAVDARTSDGQPVSVELSLVYIIDPEKVNLVHINWKEISYQDELIRPLLRSEIRNAVGEFTVESAYQDRREVGEKVAEFIAPRLEEEGFQIVTVLLRDIIFSEEYVANIEAVEFAQLKIQEETYRVQAVEQEAAQVEARAQGAANARRIEAAAEADALQLVADVLAQNPQLLEYQYVQNLSDNVQVLALPANSPFIFDLAPLLTQTTTPEPPAGQ